MYGNYSLDVPIQRDLWSLPSGPTFVAFIYSYDNNYCTSRPTVFKLWICLLQKWPIDWLINLMWIFQWHQRDMILKPTRNLFLRLGFSYEYCYIKVLNKLVPVFFIILELTVWTPFYLVLNARTVYVIHGGVYFQQTGFYTLWQRRRFQKLSNSHISCTDWHQSLCNSILCHFYHVQY